MKVRRMKMMADSRITWSTVVTLGVTLCVAAAAHGQYLGVESRISKPTPLYTPMDDNSPRISVSGTRVIAEWSLGEDQWGIIGTAWTTLDHAHEDQIWRLPRVLGPVAQPNRDFIRDGADIIAVGDGTFVAAAPYVHRPQNAPPVFGISLHELNPDSVSQAWAGPLFPFPFIPSQLPGETFYSLDLPTLASTGDGRGLFLAYLKRISTFESLDHRTELWFQARLDGVWSPPVLVAEPAADWPRIAAGTDGSVLVVWHDLASGKIMGRRWTDGRMKFWRPDFNDPIVIGPITANFAAPPRYDMKSGRPRGTHCESKLAPTGSTIAVDRSEGPRRGWMYAVWSEAMTGLVEPVEAVVSEQEPNTYAWGAQRIAVGQEVVGSSSRGSAHQGSDGDSFTFEMKAGETVQLSGSMTLLGAPQWWWCGAVLEFSRISADGRTYYGSVGNGTFAHTGPRSNLPILFTAPSDGLYWTGSPWPPDMNQTASYRLRVQRVTKSPESVARDHRDIVMVVSKDGGQTWSEKRLVNDDPPWFDNFMPEVAVDSLGRVHVSWYDRRDDPDYGMNYHVYWTWSEDGGETFNPSRALSETQSVISPRQLGQPVDIRVNFLGDRMGLCGTEEGVIGAWTFAENYKNWTGDNEHNIHVRSADVPPTATVADLAAVPAIGRTDLTWRVTDPNVLWKFDVERRRSGSEADFAPVATVERAADIRTERYSFTDTTVESDADYEYRVVLHLANGRTRPSEPVSATVPPTPTTLAIRAVESRPDGVVRLTLTAPARGTAELRLFDVQGSLIRALPPAEVEPGDTLLHWDGRDDRGQRPGSGVYFLEVRLGEARATTKLVLSGS